MYGNLLEALDNAARSDKGIRYVLSSDSETRSSYRQLREKALGVLAALQSCGLRAGDELLFQYADTEALLVNYWACLYGGIVPVPLEHGDQSNSIEKLYAVWPVMRSAWLATDDDKLHERMAAHAAATGREAVWERIRERCVQPMARPGSAEEAVLEPVAADAIAFIQFSSGSTGVPKGVALTHANLISNIGDILAAYRHAPDDVFLSWKPLTHDFGMIGFHLAPIVGMSEQVRMETDAFVWNPVLWMASADRFRATILGSPNFGYRHFLKMYRRGRGRRSGQAWDLSSIRIIVNGAEPISTELCDEFMAELAPFGLRAEAMTPAYGLAETSLMATLCPLDEAPVRKLVLDRRQVGVGDAVREVAAGDANALTVVDCGSPFPNTGMRIADAEGRALPEGRVGRIMIRGRSVTQGYYRNPERNAEAFDAEGWLDTQDLGLLHGGRLYMVGRLKEMLIVGGVNYFPHDIEQAILRGQGASELNKYIVAGVPSEESGSEELLVFVYHKAADGDIASVAADIRRHVQDAFGLNVLRVVPVRRIPKTTSGKVQRHRLVRDYLDGAFDEALADMGEPRPLPPSAECVSPQSAPAPATAVEAERVGTRAGVVPDHVERRVAEIVSRLSGRVSPDPAASFFSLGMSSLRLLDLRCEVEDAFGVTLDSTSALDFPNVRALSAHVAGRIGAADPTSVGDPAAARSGASADGAVAVVAMACRFPGAESPDAFWRLLVEGRDPVREVPAERWRSDPQGGLELATRQGGFLDGIDRFDPQFFGITPIEAEAMDPQQRLLLEVVHEAFENAGWDPFGLDGSRIAAYIGISSSEYAAVGRDLGHGTGPYTFTGSMLNTAAGRISYTFGLQGACVAVDTACSSSLVAVHHALQALRAGQCDAAVAAGVNLILKADGHVGFTRMNALSTSGRCRSFDDEADGYIRGEGCGAVVLKRLADAERDGDAVLAVIRGSAVNHNGHSGGLTVPSGQAQERLIRTALADAGIAPDRVDYLEAHGSGTRLGDPQELNALARAFSGRDRTLTIGSVKSNVGHLESAAGIAGLIKTVQMLRHGRIAPNLHFRNGNRLMDWNAVPFRVADRALDWERRQAPRCAGVSSFGISGTNAHVVLEEYVPAAVSPTSAPESDASVSRREWHVLPLGARTDESLRDTARRFATAPALERASLDAVCSTVARRHSGHPSRAAFAANSIESLRARLLRFADAGEAMETAAHSAAADVVFLYSGQGSVWPGVAREAHAGSRVFRDAFDHCIAAFEPTAGTGLRSIALGGAGEAAALDSPLVSQPLIFAVQYALGAFWESVGLRPAAVLGHSIGEYAAACRAGVMSLDDAVRMVSLRARLMEEATADGAMVGVLAAEAEVRALIAEHPGTYIAAMNTDDNITVSGERDAVRALAAAARKRRIFIEALPMRHAFHSPLMAAGADALRAGLGDIAFAAPVVPLYSSQRGGLSGAGDVSGRDYWGAHLCEPVLFRDALRAALADGHGLFLEIGGSAVLSGLGAQIDAAASFLPSLRQAKPAWQQLSESAAELYGRGVSLNWRAWQEGDGTRIAQDLPNTAYDRARYWHPQAGNAEPAAPHAHPQTPAKPAVPVPMRAAAATPAAADVEAVVAASVRTADLGAMVVADLCETISLVTGIPVEDMSPDANIFELGIDSLMLAQIDKRVQKRYGVNIPVKLFFSRLNSPAHIATYLVEQMPEDIRRERLHAFGLQSRVGAAVEPGGGSASSVATNAYPALDTASAAAASSLESIVQSQLSLMREQLALLRGERAAPIEPPPSSVAPAASSARKTHAQTALRPADINALRNMTLREEDLDPRQAAFVRDLVARLVAKTPKSKAYAERYRDVLADWIATLNFSLTTKEMAYPVVAARSRGARFWDIDGNEYIDTATGYGATFFGHNPDFVVDALRHQLDRGMELGPQSELAGEVASLIAEMTGAERVTFCNSGTEAVMVAIRLARAATRRSKVVRFINAYHGSFDGVLADAGEDGAVPMAPGIVDSMVQDTVVVHYGTPGSLQIIRALGSDLAAVLVEPVQSRAPHNHSTAYLRQLRELTQELGAALIFDEMITGFRTGPGGAAEYFDVRPDLSTYGKVAGGGMPIGVVAGSGDYMDAIDGGRWRFGDRSGPTRETTFFAGTFCKHPLAMAAARAVLQRLKDEGPVLQTRVNALTAGFCERANAFFRAEGVPIEAQCFGSLYRFETLLSQDPARSSLEMNLLFRLMMLDGVFVWERRTSFFSAAHTEEDADRILDAVRRATAALRAGGFGFRVAGGGNGGGGGGGGGGVGTGMPSGSSDLMPALDVDGYPLSSEERRMYVLSLMKGGEFAYHVVGALRILGRYDEARGERALAALTARHPILRTAYVHDGEALRHRVSTQIAVPLRYRDAAQAPVEALMSGFVRGFDLTAAPLWRVEIVRLGDEERLLAMDFHHLIADGLSVSLLIEEFRALYRGETLASAGPGYAGFVEWECRFVQSADYAQQREYWLERLSPLPAPLELPLDRPRPAQSDFSGASVRFALEPEYFRRVRELARATRTTPFMVLLAAYFVLLRTLSRQRDICVGTPFDRRGHGDFDRTVGMFAQTLVIRADASPEQDFATLLEGVREACTGAYAHPDVALDELVSGLGIPRDFSRNPLFDTMFIYENGNRRAQDLGEAVVEPVSVPMQGSAFDLTLEVTECAGTLNCAMIYATRLLDATTVQRWAGHFRRLLDRVLDAPQTPIREADPLDAAERQWLLDARNDTLHDYPREETVVERFRATARAEAGRLALRAGGTELSYAALDAASDRLARHLRARGVAAGDLVGIALPRREDLVVAMLAVLKAGAAYVPIDPGYPAARVSLMLDRAKAKVLLARSADAAAFGALDARLLDPQALADDTSSDDQTLVAPASRDLAYVIFTSGSTGEPKGVMLEHASVANFVRGMEEALAPLPAPTMLGITSVSFDIFVLEVFVTLLNGGTLVLADEDAQRDPGIARALIAASGVDCVQLTPSRLQSLLAVAEVSEVFAGVNTLLVGGEAFPDALLPALQALPHLRVFNVYGPTETTVWSTVKRLGAGDRHATLGTPIANTRAYVLDEGLRPRPIGCVGDLYLAGDGLARGYLDDPARTDAVFVADPFVPGARMYRTGDSAAWTVDGELVYRGRTDSQVKLRGYRIEVAEIETVLGQAPEVGMAAVSVRELTPGNPVLIAHYLVSAAATETAEEALAARLRAMLAERLPAYMVPAALLQVASLPTTPNGKIDRRALAALPVSAPSPAPVEDEDLPEDAIERALFAIWERILGERRFDRRTSFFDAGGNSFSLVTMHAELSKAYPGALEVADLFATPTVAALRARIAEALEGGAERAPPEMSFPQAFFGGVSENGEASLRSHLEGEANAAFRALAEELGVHPLDLALALCALYLHKWLAREVVELALRSGGAHACLRVDFSQARGLKALVADVAAQRADGPAVRFARAQAPADPRGVRLLVIADDGRTPTDRDGFDCALRLRAQQDALRLTLDYDAGRLAGAALREFAANYLKLVRALTAGATPRAEA